MLEGTCHCSAVRWTLKTFPETATACNCSVCRRYGALWAYGYFGTDVRTTGQTRTYLRRDSGDICFHFCIICGCVTHYVARRAAEDGRTVAAINIRMSDPSAIGEIPIRHFDGHDSFEELPSDGRTVKDMWF